MYINYINTLPHFMNEVVKLVKLLNQNLSFYLHKNKMTKYTFNNLLVFTRVPILEKRCGKE